MKTNDESYAEAVGELLVQVYAIHAVAAEGTGGPPELRSGKKLHAAVARPYATFAGEDLYVDEFEKAAALFHSLIDNQPFESATKATALLSALYFLETYGHPIPDNLPKNQVVAFCLDVAEENLRKAAGEAIQPRGVPEIAAWLRELVG